MALNIGRSRRLIALDWDAQFLRMTVVTSRGANVDLQKAVTVPILPDLALSDAAALGSFVKESLKRSRLSGKHALISVPREKVVLNTINLPPAPAEELPAMVINQVARELPFAADQAVIDFALSTDHDPKAPATALVAAVRVDDIEFYKKVANAAGLQLERIGLRPFANRQAVLATIDNPDDKTILMVELGPEHSEISVVHESTLKFSRSALTSLPDFRDEPIENLHDSRIESLAVHDARSSERTREAVSGLMVEVIRSFEAYRATATGASIDRIVVCGSTGLEAELSQSLAARFAALAELFNPAKALAIDPDRAKELRGFSVALGLAMSHGRHPLTSFDFLAPKRPISKRTQRMKKVPRAILIGVILIATAVSAWIKSVAPVRAKANDLLDEIRELQEREEPLTDFTGRVQALTDWTEAEQVWPDELVRLTNAFPSNEKAQVTRIEFHTRPVGRTKNRRYVSTVEMRIRTAELGVVNEISDTLREMGYLDVIPGSETPIRGRNDSVYQFESRIEARIPKRKESDSKVPTPDLTPAIDELVDDNTESTITSDKAEQDDSDTEEMPLDANEATDAVEEERAVDTQATMLEVSDQNRTSLSGADTNNQPNKKATPTERADRAPLVPAPGATGRPPPKQTETRNPVTKRTRAAIQPPKSRVKKPVASPVDDVVENDASKSLDEDSDSARTRVRIPPAKPVARRPAAVKPKKVGPQPSGESPENDEAAGNPALTEEDGR